MPNTHNVNFQDVYIWASPGENQRGLFSKITVRRGIQGVCVKIYPVSISIESQLEDSTKLPVGYEKVPVNKTWGKALWNIFYYYEHCRKILSSDKLEEETPSQQHIAVAILSNVCSSASVFQNGQFCDLQRSIVRLCMKVSMQQPTDQ